MVDLQIQQLFPFLFGRFVALVFIIIENGIYYVLWCIDDLEQLEVAGRSCPCYPYGCLACSCPLAGSPG